MSLILGEQYDPVNSIEALARALYYDMCWDIRSGFQWEDAPETCRRVYLDRAIIVERKCAEHGTVLVQVGSPVVADA